MDRIAMLSEILSANPGDAFARYGLAMEYAKAGQVEAAMAEFTRLLELSPDYVPGYQMGAQTLAAAGRTEEARQMFQRGIAAAARASNAHAQQEMQGMLDELS